MLNFGSDFKSHFFSLQFPNLPFIKSLSWDLTHFQSVFFFQSTSVYQEILKISYAYCLLTEIDVKIHHINCSCAGLQGIKRYCVDTVRLGQYQSNVDLGGSSICKSASRQ